MDYKKAEKEFLDRQKQEREDFSLGVELNKTRDALNAYRVEHGLEPMSIDDMFNKFNEFALKGYKPNCNSLNKKYAFPK